MAANLTGIAEQFCDDVPVAIDPFGSGHINDTYRVSLESADGERPFILQRVNRRIFRDPAALMSNILRVTSHVQRKLQEEGCQEIERRALRVVPSRHGSPLYWDAGGDCWRAYNFIESAQTFDVPESADAVYEAAKAFGKFLVQLSDLPGDRLAETIPHFHDTRMRFNALLAAAKNDFAGRAKGVRKELEFALERESEASILIDLLRAGKLKERIAHNDTKLNNVMMCQHTNKGICVIDLDTVMPGLWLHDYGEMVRTMACTSAEDETDLSRVGLRLDHFNALTEGFLTSAGSQFTPEELDLFPLAGKLMTLENGVRFLTDYLKGDVYYKTYRDNQNLDRCRTQLSLVECIEQESSLLLAKVRSLSAAR